RFSSARGALSSEGTQRLQVLGTFGDLDRAPAAPELVLGTPPELPEPERCLRIEPGEGFPPPFTRQVEMRTHPDDARFLEGARSGTPTIHGRLRLPDGEPVGTLPRLTLLDSFPPTVFNVDLPIAWTPTLELTAHVRARPVPGWLAGEFRTRFVTGGFLEVDGELWDPSGRLVAQSRQLALVPRGDGWTAGPTVRRPRRRGPRPGTSRTQGGRPWCTGRTRSRSPRGRCRSGGRS